METTCGGSGMSREAMELALEMPIDIRVIKIIFEKMAQTYGNDFIDSRDAQMQTWAKELAGFRRHEIDYVLERLPDKPPNVIQFRAVCRMAPPLWW